MAKQTKLVVLFLLLSAIGAVGCTSSQTFTPAVRSGDTVQVTIGYRPGASRESTAVVIQDAAGTITRYEPGDSHIRTIVNLYPDPASVLLVGHETGQDLGANAVNLGDYANFLTSNDMDWFMTTVYFDLPDPMAIGTALVSVETHGVSDNAAQIPLEIIGNGGAPYGFGVKEWDPGVGERLDSLQRAEHYTARLVGLGAAYVAAMQVTFTHNPDVGVAYVANGRGDRRSVEWSDDGTRLKVMVSQAGQNTLIPKDFKLVIAGGITGLEVAEVRLYDALGQPVTGPGIKIDPRISGVDPLGPYTPGQPVTLAGEYLCYTCSAPYDTTIEVGSDSTGWQTATVTAATPQSLTFTMPATVPDGVIFLSRGQGVDSIAMRAP
jgi:hypothetical protein